MDKSTTERLAEYMIFRGINNNMITVSAGLSVGQIGKAISNNSGINSTSIEKILYTYPEINPEWLLTGNGNMLKSGIDRPPKDVIPPYREQELLAIIEGKNAIIKDKNKIIDGLEFKVATLEKEVTQDKRHANTNQPDSARVAESA